MVAAWHSCGLWHINGWRLLQEHKSTKKERMWFLWSLQCWWKSPAVCVSMTLARRGDVKNANLISLLFRARYIMEHGDVQEWAYFLIGIVYQGEVSTGMRLRAMQCFCMLTDEETLEYLAGRTMSDLRLVNMATIPASLIRDNFSLSYIVFLYQEKTSLFGLLEGSWSPQPDILWIWVWILWQKGIS